MDANSIRAAGDDPVARPTWMLVALRALRPETTRRQGRDETDSQDSERAEHPCDARDAPLTLTCRRHGADGLSSCCDEPHSSLIGGRRAYLESSDGPIRHAVTGRRETAEPISSCTSVWRTSSPGRNALPQRLFEVGDHGFDLARSCISEVAKG